MRRAQQYGGPMTVSKAQMKAQNSWIAKAYDRINLTEEIQKHAHLQGESVNKFINRAIDETITNDRSE